MCMRARSDVTSRNCTGCSNHTFGRVMIHFADRVWGKRSNPGNWMLRWLWLKFVCTAHSARITCTEVCALLTLLILFVLKCVHCSVCSNYLCWRYCVWTCSCFLHSRFFTRFIEETASWMTDKSRSSSFFYPFKAQWLAYVPPCLILKNLRSATQNSFLCLTWISESTAIIYL